MERICQVSTTRDGSLWMLIDNLTDAEPLEGTEFFLDRKKGAIYHEDDLRDWIMSWKMNGETTEVFFNPPSIGCTDDEWVKILVVGFSEIFKGQRYRSDETRTIKYDFLGSQWDHSQDLMGSIEGFVVAACGDAVPSSNVLYRRLILLAN